MVRARVERVDLFKFKGTSAKKPRLELSALSRDAAVLDDHALGK